MAEATDETGRGTRHGSNSLTAALSRSLASGLSFLFARPIRLFRPTKVSAFTAVQALAHERGKSLSPATLRSILKDEGWRFFPRHVIPPFVANTLIGFSLFWTYQSSDFFLRNFPTPVPDRFVPFVCGATAGIAQAVISSPLDNVRMLLSRRPPGSKFSWISVVKEALFPAFLVGQPQGSPISRFGQLRYLARWASRGWSLYALSLIRDALGFGSFFLMFEEGRKVARRVGTAIDRELRDSAWPGWLAGGTEEERQKRGWIGRTTQAVILVAGGSLAGLSYGIIGRPFDVARKEIWQGRMNWAEKEGLASRKPEPSASSSGRADPPRSRLSRLFGSSFLKRRSVTREAIPTLPSARDLLHRAVKRDGLRLFFVPPETGSRLDNHPALGGASVFSGGAPKSTALRAAKMGGLLVRFLTVVPPYSLAFLAYAVVSGDLR